MYNRNKKQERVRARKEGKDIESMQKIKRQKGELRKSSGRSKYKAKEKEIKKGKENGKEKREREYIEKKGTR